MAPTEGVRTDEEYKNANDEQLVTWANERDAEALERACSRAAMAKVDKDYARALKIIGKLEQSILVTASASRLVCVALVFDKLERYDEAMRWFKVAAEKGASEAGFYIGVIFENREEYGEAFTWYKQSADRGDKEGQYMTGHYFFAGRGCKGDKQEAYRYMKLSADQGDLDANKELDVYAEAARSEASGACVIATACIGDSRVAPLRRLRDDAIASDPVARDFFHVFWSRYYEWSPAVARIARQDRAVAEHIRWGFLDPWLAWMEFASIVGRRDVSDLPEIERREILQRLGGRLQSWLKALPSQLEGKCPSDPALVVKSFDRFREVAQQVFRELSSTELGSGASHQPEMALVKDG